MAATGHFLTTTVTKLELLRGDLQIGTATGFFLFQREQWHLVTNWHVMSGRDPKTGRPRRKDGAVPSEVRFFRLELTEPGLQWVPITYHLGDVQDGTAVWLQHPTLGQGADIAVLRIAPETVGKAKNILDPEGHDPSMWIDLGQELFLPGYPLGLTGEGLFPVWKRASLASSLEFGKGISTQFLVDTATREGMSGAPCFALANWHYYALNRDTGKMSRVERPLSWRWLGVYSGRMNPSDTFEAQLGVVWRETLVMDTANANERARVILKNP